MDLISLAKKCKDVQCPRFDERKHRLQTLEWLRTGYVYKALDLPDFDQRRTPIGKYLPVAERRPSSRYDIVSIAMRDIVAMLSGDGRFPIVTFGDPNEQPDPAPTSPPAADPAADPATQPLTAGQQQTKNFAELIRIVGLASVMNRAATLSGIGSVAIVPEVITPKKSDDPPWLSFAMWRAFEVDPVFRTDRPGVLESATRTWFVKRSQLAADGYDLKELDRQASAQIDAQNRRNGQLGAPQERQFEEWYRRCTLDEHETINFVPVPKELYHRKDFDAWIKDDERSGVHDLGFCPAWWHITVEDEDHRPDGVCLFTSAVDNQLLIERVLSVAAAAVVAAGTPQLAISTAGASNGLPQESEGPEPGARDIDPDSVIEVGEKGGAWLVQMEGGMSPLDVVIERLRATALENVGGSRMTPETLAGAKSGYAMELLNQALTYVAGMLRPQFERSVIGVGRMVARMRQKFDGLACEGGDVPEFDPDATVKAVSYGPNYELSGQDKQMEVGAIVAASQAGLISHETAIAQVAQLFDVTDVETEVKKVQVQTQQSADDEHQKAIELAKTAPPKETP